MRKILLTLVIFSLILIASTNAHAIAISGLYNTGVDDSGDTLAVGSLDTHYTLTPATGSSPAYVITKHSAWAPITTANAMWIGPINGNIAIPAPGIYSYITTFDLTGLDHTTASISGKWAADNEVDLFLNGVDTGLGIIGFGSLTDFNLNSGFIAGINTLEYRVINYGGAYVGTSGTTYSNTPNPTSLLISGLTGEANAVPEPASMLLFGTGLVGAVLRRRRK